MPQTSCGLLMYKTKPELRFFLVHPGGPYFQNKNEAVWTIPKGLREDEEELLSTAQREFKEETGIAPRGPFESLGSTKMKSGKILHAWAFKGDWEEKDGIRSNMFEMEWPPRTGKMATFPEADRGKWCSYEEAVLLIHTSQNIFLERLLTHAPNLIQKL